MASNGAGSQPLWFSTESLPEHERVAVWREVYGQTILRLDIEPLPDLAFKANIALRALPGLRLVSGTISGACDQRTRALMSDGNDDFGLAVNWSGASNSSQCGRQALLNDGDAVLLSCGDVGTFNRPLPSHYIGLRMPRATLTAQIPGVEDRIGLRIPRTNAALGLLKSYVAALLSDEQLDTAEFQHIAVKHIYDLVLLTLGTTGDAEVAASGRGGRAARLRAVKIDIDNNISRRGFTIDVVAARHRITPRYIQRLFADEDTSFTDYVLNQRLIRAHRLLTDPRLVDRAVSAIAFEAGFGDLSYFNRMFRRAFKATPSEVRAKARGD